MSKLKFSFLVLIRKSGLTGRRNGYAKAGCDAGVLTYGIIPPNAADVENTVKSLMDFGAADVIKSACEILEYNLFEEKTCRLKQ